MMYDFEDLVRGLLLLREDGIMSRQNVIDIIEIRLRYDLEKKL